MFMWPWDPRVRIYGHQYLRSYMRVMWVFECTLNFLGHLRESCSTIKRSKIVEMTNYFDVNSKAL